MTDMEIPRWLAGVAGEGVITFCKNPQGEPLPDGGRTLHIRVPALRVDEYIHQPDRAAEAIADVLNGAEKARAILKAHIDALLPRSIRQEDVLAHDVLAMLREIEVALGEAI